MTSSAERARALVARMTLEEKVSQLWHAAPAIPRLDVPAYNWWNEALHGVARAGRATVFPQAIGLAATFDPDLVREIASAIGDEGRAKHLAAAARGNRGPYVGLTYWSPNVNIYRDLRWGRGQETWGEDPTLTSRMAVAFVRGLQGDDPERLKAAACAKHFYAHSGPEEGRAGFDAEVSPRDACETYLPAFEALVREGRVEGVMCAYNRVNGEPCCGSPEVVRSLLRERLGFDGYVVTDCWAGEQLHSHHHLVGTLEEAVARAVKAGVNVFCGSARDALLDAVEQGFLAEAEIDEALVRALRTRFRLGLFDPPAPPPAPVDSAPLARRAAAESFVLLKNERDVLPLSPSLGSVFVTGPCAASVEALLGNYFGVSDSLVTVLEGVSARIDNGTTLAYAKGCPLDQSRTNPADWASQHAREADVTLAVMGLTNELVGEEGDAILSEHGADWPSLRLPICQVEYLKALRGDHERPIVLVLATGVPLILDDVEPYVDAILLVWCPGQEGGHAVADVLFGDAEPGGRMPVTVPRSLDDLPAFDDYSMRGRTYRFARKEPLYAFGSGLGYTTFAVHDLTVSPAVATTDETVEVTATLENTGARAGTEVVQLYLTDPREDADKPLRSLKVFARVALAAGATASLRFQIPPSFRVVIDERGRAQTAEGRWEVRLGTAGGHFHVRCQALRKG